jgi:hypothetical protein
MKRLAIAFTGLSSGKRKQPFVAVNRVTSTTRNSSSSPYNTEAASDILVASLLEVVETNSMTGPRALARQARPA